MFLGYSCCGTMVMLYELFTIGHHVSNRISPERTYSQRHTLIVVVPCVFWLNVNWKTTHLAICMQLFDQSQRQYNAYDVSKKCRTYIKLSQYSSFSPVHEQKSVRCEHPGTYFHMTPCISRYEKSHYKDSTAPSLLGWNYSSCFNQTRTHFGLRLSHFGLPYQHWINALFTAVKHTNKHFWHKYVLCDMWNFCGLNITERM